MEWSGEVVDERVWGGISSRRRSERGEVMREKNDWVRVSVCGLPMCMHVNRISESDEARRKWRAKVAIDAGIANS